MVDNCPHFIGICPIKFAIAEETVDKGIPQNKVFSQKCLLITPIPRVQGECRVTQEEKGK